MYRVELKGIFEMSACPIKVFMFLMYRVELKDASVPIFAYNEPTFLMYRVELKGQQKNPKKQKKNRS